MINLSPVRRRYLMDPWRDALVTHLRLALVRGSVIGDALAEVDAHCIDTGEDPADAFGDPATYAAAIAANLPPSARVTGPQWWPSALQAAGTVLGVTFLLTGIDALANGGQGLASLGAVSRGSLLSAVLVVLVTLAMIALLPRLASPKVTRSTASMIALLCLGLAGAMLPPVLWPARAFSAPGWALLTGGVLALAIWLPFLGVLRRDRQDRVIDPRTGQEPFVTPKLVGILAWALPAVLLVAALLVVTVPAPR